MIHLDTSALVDALVSPHRSFDRLMSFVEDGHRLCISTLVLYEWLRGPRTVAERLAQEQILPAAAAVPFDAEAAARAAEIYEAVSRPRARQADIAIAACALVQGASLWTLNERDFADVPELEIVQ